MQLSMMHTHKVTSWLCEASETKLSNTHLRRHRCRTPRCEPCLMTMSKPRKQHSVMMLIMCHDARQARRCSSART